jgi:hypothetical protein
MSTGNMKAGNRELLAKRAEEKRISVATLNKVTSEPARMAEIPATMTDVEARGVADMHKTYNRVRSSGEGTWPAKCA